jgi:hypothetical protein
MADHGPFHGSPRAASHRSDRNSKSDEPASDEIPRLRGVANAETGRNRCLPCTSEGDLRPGLLKRLWTFRSRVGLA